MDDRVFNEVIDCPSAQVVQDGFLNTQVLRITLAWEFIRLVGTADGNLIILHLNILINEVASPIGLLRGVEETPAGIELDVDVELRFVLPQLVIRSVDADYVTDVLNDGAVFDSLCVNNGSRVLKTGVGFCSRRMQSCVDEL